MTTSLSCPDGMYGARMVVSNDASLDVDRRVPRTVHPLRRKVWATWAASWGEYVWNVEISLFQEIQGLDDDSV